MSQEAAPAAAATAPPPHVLLVCFPSQGHVNPTLRFAKRLAAKGLLVTCCTTSGAGAQIAAAAASSPGVLSSGRDGDGVPVGLGRVRFEFLDDRGNEKDDLMRYFATSASAAFAELLGRQAAAGRPVACVVGNPFLPWVVDAAASAGVPSSAVLWVQSCAVFSIYYHYARGLVELPPEDDPEARVALPGFPPLSTAECTDAKFLVEELGMGVRLRAPLRREAVREALDAAVAGPEADAMRASARSWSAVARAAVAAGGSSDQNVQVFVDEVMRRASGRQAADVTSSG
ncbi:hypothetical protein C2845_PM08G04770 [Panicum miliaceum]|uniref:Uncharacterized protein n=1 Tax=Panicum miliaceum TaxID=4540 RepID=A0A3L6QWT2_PANMI|nr:hypothetical protein C2845_PM08G04770 [Panicum miliaceum]